MVLSAKYIEGLENRLGRMEALLKLSGLLNDEDVDRTDLSMLEKKLADKTMERLNGTTPQSDAPRLSVSQPRSTSGSNPSLQQANKIPSPQSSAASPAMQEEEKPEEEVEALSDMMCSLVTNNCGETRYIGDCSLSFLVKYLAYSLRLLLRVLNIFTQRYPVDQREDWRQFIPRDDIKGGSGRHQMGLLET